ncbi:VWA domain-containing protein [Thiobacillus sp.]|jgi:Ca-activated chloride channel family protein|uniref:VWA domain-containing protein n=1 Tax=Thiobacillus sp. TaxID=924 RepID=UPI0025F24566|nr:VWA domain-containing protein [Thiobacillus sp.]
MIELQSLHWREPLWLGLAAVPMLFGVWRRRRRARLLRYADAALLPWAVASSAVKQESPLRTLAHVLAWLLLALAAAGPRLPLDVHDGQPVSRHLLTMMVVLDISASMRATDTVPDRFGRARLELLDWLTRLQGERVGLIVYAGEAGVLLPPTDDPTLLRRAIDQANPSLIEAQGTNLAGALDLARTQLLAAPGQAKAILLVTDAEAGSFDAAAETAGAALRKAHVPVFVLGMGSEAGAPVPLPDGGFAERDGAQLLSRMDASPYRELARETEGRFAVVSDGDTDWLILHDQGIASLPGDPVVPQHAIAWHELYAWCLAPALALLMAVSLPRRVGVLIALVVCGTSAMPTRVLADEAAAWQAWQQRHYAHAQTLYAQVGGYTGRMGAGAAAWRQADYAAAARHFGAALLLADNDRQRADALYDLGNALYARKRWKAAFEAFETVLRMRPGDARARANLQQAWQQLRRQRAEVPMHSDLGGRRGFLAEGRIQLDGQPANLPDEPESGPAGVQLDRNPAASGTRRGEAPAARQAPTVDPRLALSGLAKLERLDDRPAAMLKNLLKQDARHDDTERPPW